DPGSESPFCAGRTVMRADGGAIDHLQGRGIGIDLRKRLQHDVPHPRQGPATKLLIDRIPGAELLGQIAPWCSGPGDPEYPVEGPSMVARRPAAACSAVSHERLEDLPFLVDIRQRAK